MSDTTKGVWHRKEAEPGNYAKGWDALWGGSDGLREMPTPEGEEGSTEAGGPEAA